MATKKRRSRCRYRKGQKLVHVKLGECEVVKTKKANVTHCRYHIHLQFTNGGTYIMPDNDTSLRSSR
jgi:hypothetical protein